MTHEETELCRICGEKPAYEDGVCRWESCEAEAAAEEAAARVRVEYEIMDRELARHEARLAGVGRIPG